MKTYMKWIYAIAGSALLLPAAYSCSKESGYDYSLLQPNATVTVKQVDGNSSFYLQLDDNTTLEPVNMATSPFDEQEVRAFVNYSNVDEPSEKYDRKVTVNWLKKILTKNMVPNLGDGNDKEYGSDGVEIANSWVTVVEDGYLTLQFMTPAGNSGIAHEVNLVYAGTDDDKWVVEFRHNAHGDYRQVMASGFAAFRLARPLADDSKDDKAAGDEDNPGNDGLIRLPETNGETVRLKLRYKSLDGSTKTIEFDYCTGKGTNTEDNDIDPDAQYSLKVK